MSLVNIAQMIEKELQRLEPHTFWRDKNIRKCETEKSSIFGNSLTGTGTEPLLHEKQSEIDSEDRDFFDNIKQDQHSFENAEDDSDILETDNDLSDDVDETDYFDSEDEYWDSFINKTIEENTSPCRHCFSYHLPRSIHEESKTCIYEETYDLSPWCTPAIRKFIKDNNFEIKDVYGDGNCLFRAVADQLMINGCPGHTEASLREMAIKHLENYSSKYGVQVSSFVSGETWKHYFQRMKKSGEWSDHILFQALADVYLLHISIYTFKHIRAKRIDIATEQPSSVTTKFHIDLGHIGESHYFSLRPLQWVAEIPYKAQIFRTLVTNTDKSSEARTQLLENKFVSVVKKHFSEYHFVNDIQFVVQYLSFQKERKDIQDTSPQCIFLSFNGEDLQQEDTKDSKKALIKEELYTDPVSGLPLHHLTFIVKHVFPFHMFYTRLLNVRPVNCVEDVFFHFIGIQADESVVSIRNIHRNREPKSEIRRIVVLVLQKLAIFPNSSVRPTHNSELLYVDCSETYPGFCRLSLFSPDSCHKRSVSHQFDQNGYQKAFKVPDHLPSLLKLKDEDKIHCMGVHCLTFPFHRRWEGGRNKFNFPSQFILSSIAQIGCTLIPRSHPKSACPEIEWQFDFSMAEHAIFKSLTVLQLHSFLVIKVLLENITHTPPFKTKYLKSVFLMTCEEVPFRCWETNFSGCLLYVLDSFISCLKSRFLPNYFMLENNLIGCLKEEDINVLCTTIEYVRLFPSNAIQIVAEKYGYAYGSNLIKQVLSNAKTFTEKKNIEAFYDFCGPLTIATAKVLAKMGFYDSSLDILQDRFEQSLLIPEIGLRQTSLSFLDLFLSALTEIKQKASRVILSRMYDIRMGSNVTKTILKKKGTCLQTCLPWTVDKRICWLGVPSTDIRDLTAVANFLFNYSKREYWRRNVVLAELAITTAIRCIQETLNMFSLSDVEDNKDIELKAEIDSQKTMVMKKLIPFYVLLFSVSRIEFTVLPLINYMNDIENLCNAFPEMAGLVSSMFAYTRQPHKEKEYARKLVDYIFGKEMAHIPGRSFPSD